MAMIRWEPVRDLLTLQDRMNRTLDSSCRGAADEEWPLGGSWAKPRQIQINVGK